MTNSTFVHLRVHTAYSLSEGEIKISKLVDLCKEHQIDKLKRKEDKSMGLTNELKVIDGS